MAQIESCDVLVIGAGAGGLAAAIAAAHSGANVIVAEGADKIGGAAAYSGGQVWVGLSDPAAEAGIADSRADVESYLEWLSEGGADPALRQVYIDRGPEAIRFLRERGVPLTVARHSPDYYYPVAPGSKPEGRIHEIEPWDQRQLGALIDRVATSPYGAGWLSTQDRVECGGQAPTPELEVRRLRHMKRGERCGGPGLAAALAKSAADHGATFFTSTRAVRLLSGSGRVTGAIVRDASGEREIQARFGVIIATGGYDWNAEKQWELDKISGLKSMAPITTRGDHFKLTREFSAAVAVVRQPHTSGAVFGTHTPGEYRDGEPVFRYFTPGLPHSIVVNAAGRRFADDAFHMSLVEGVSGGRANGRHNWPAWVIVDQAYLDKYPVGAIAPGGPIPAGMAIFGDTIEEMARAAGIDGDGLAAELRRFNEFAATGVDRDFGRGTLPYTRALHGDPRMPNPNLGALAEPPFAAFPLTRVGVNCPAAGLVTGINGEVRDEAGRLIPGLYAAGNCSAQLDIGVGYNSGMGNQRGLLYGYLAATAISKSA
ncbi:FAD-dependent oxidoreductase [Rhodococcus sp. NPDC127530]|uniref:FAD-dependent oxidoreductase n=1 Tax=unclassified Rhodococcus (in: high G+C Gram-positive bacteria) TaxID=192944 RepID=UPI0036317815